MPIEKMFKTRHISEEAFREIDFQIMDSPLRYRMKWADIGMKKFIRMNWLIDVKKLVFIKLKQKCQ